MWRRHKRWDLTQECVKGDTGVYSLTSHDLCHRDRGVKAGLGTWQSAERTSTPVPLRVVLMDRVIDAAGHEKPERRVSVQFGGGGSMQAGWESDGDMITGSQGISGLALLSCNHVPWKRSQGWQCTSQCPTTKQKQETLPRANKPK